MGESNPSLEHLVDSVYKTAKSCNVVMAKKLNGRNVLGPVWFRKECQDMKKVLNRALKLLRKNKKSKVRLNQYNKAKQDFKKACQQHKEEFYASVQERLKNSKSSAQFYAELKVFWKKNRPTTSFQLPIIEFKKFFENVFNYKTDEAISVETVDQQNTDKEIEDLDRDFSITELNTSIKKLSRKKAPSSDCIPNEVWKSSTPEFRVELLATLNELFNKKVFPDSWSEIVIVQLHKKNSQEDPANYRLVSLANTILKLLTIMLGNRLNKWNSKSMVISDYQAAYKKGSGCMDHIFVLNSALQHNVSRRKKVYALFVDLSQAFDTVQHDALWEKLKKKGMSTKFICCVKI